MIAWWWLLVAGGGGLVLGGAIVGLVISNAITRSIGRAFGWW